MDQEELKTTIKRLAVINGKALAGDFNISASDQDFVTAANQKLDIADLLGVRWGDGFDEDEIMAAVSLASLQFMKADWTSKEAIVLLAIVLMPHESAKVASYQNAAFKTIMDEIKQSGRYAKFRMTLATHFPEMLLDMKHHGLH